MSTAQELKTEGNKAFQSQEYQKAIEFYTKAIELQSDDVTFYSNRSGAFYNIGDFESALKDGEKCVEMDKNFVKGYLRKGTALEKLDRKDEANVVYEEGLKIEPENKDFISGKSRCEASGFDIQSLLSNPMVQNLIQKNPQLAQQLFSNPEMLKNPQMMQMMMNLFAQQQNSPPQPNQHSQSPFEDKQFNPDPCGEGHDHSHDYSHEHQDHHTNDSTHQQEQTTEHKPQQLTSQPQTNHSTNSEFDKLKKQADQKYLEKNFDKAIELYQQCIELNQEHLIPRSNMAICYLEKKDYEKAHEILDEAIKIYTETDFSKRSFEDYAKVLEKKARVYQLQNDLTNAIQQLEKSLLENNIGRVSAQLREMKKLKKKQEEKAYIDPVLSEKHRQLGNDLFQQQKYPEAIKEYEEAQKRNPSDNNVNNNLCACFMKLMRFDEAKKFAQKVLEVEPGNIKALLRLGGSYFFLKEYHKAIDVYQSVLKIDESNQEAKKGLMDTQIKIQSQMHAGTDEERVQRAMQDPEVHSIMIDPMVRIALEQMQTSPQKAMEYMKDPTLGPKIQKLIQAGILKVA